MAIKIALAGNPNCGKTTLFNALTGSNQFVGNWPGVTVEKKEGKLKKQYGGNEMCIRDRAETERLRNLEFSYQDQTNMLYQDEENYCSVAYVAMANWIDRYEYAITLDDSNTIIYVYLQNMDAKDIHMQSDYLPKYFQDNNAGKHQDTDPMTSDYRSFYAFRIGDHYIDCMDLADQIEIADTEPETQAADVAQEVESN